VRTRGPEGVGMWVKGAAGDFWVTGRPLEWVRGITDIAD